MANLTLRLPKGSPLTYAEVDNNFTSLNSSFAYRNVKDFGAVGTYNRVAHTGTDDTTAIQNAIDAVYAAGGGTVFLPSGMYGVTGLTRAWIGATGADITTVNIIGEGTLSTGLVKIGETDVPVLDLTATAVQTPRCVIGGFAIFGNNFAHDGIRVTLLSRMVFKELAIYECATGFNNRGTQLSTVSDTALTNNARGYQAIEWQDAGNLAWIQPNAMQFFGGEIRTNSSWGVEIHHGDLTTFYGTNFERNGTVSNNATGALVVRGTIDYKEQWPTVEVHNCYFEENRGGRVIFAEESNLTLVLRNIHMFATAADGNSIAVEAIKLLHLENYSAYGTGASTISAATSTIISGGRTGTYTDNSSTTYIPALPSAEIVTAANVITAAENGKTFYLGNVAGVGYTSTLPAPALGLSYKFFVYATPTNGGYLIRTNAGATVMSGTYLDIVGQVAFSGQNTITFVVSAAAYSDGLEVHSDGAGWHCRAFSRVDGGITASVT